MKALKHKSLQIWPTCQTVSTLYGDSIDSTLALKNIWLFSDDNFKRPYCKLHAELTKLIYLSIQKPKTSNPATSSEIITKCVNIGCQIICREIFGCSEHKEEWNRDSLQSFVKHVQIKLTLREKK